MALASSDNISSLKIGRIT